MLLAFRRPTVLAIHPQSWARPAGSIDFRVTQRFDVPDSFYGGAQKHNAVDLGNFRCGDVVVAMAPGRVRRTKDNATALGAITDALGLVIDHGYGVTSEYWHLGAYTVADGAQVAAGQPIAAVGRTGLGNVCHLHIEVKRDGVRIDPEPLMFGASLIVEEGEMKLPVGMAHIAQGLVGANNRLRRDPFSTIGSRVLDGEIYVQVYGKGIPGQPYTIGNVSGSSYAFVGAYGEAWYVAEPLLRDVQLTQAGQALIPPVIDNRVERARTAALGADQALDAVLAALG
jgi:hypothetical protein